MASMDFQPPVVDGAEFFAAERLRWHEKEFQAEVLKLAAEHGWTHRYHTFFSKRSETGFPDVVLVRPSDGRMIIAELKTTNGRLGPAQESWRDALVAVERRVMDTDASSALRVYVWRPADWNAGTIAEALR